MQGIFSFFFRDVSDSFPVNLRSSIGIFPITKNVENSLKKCDFSNHMNCSHEALSPTQSIE